MTVTLIGMPSCGKSAFGRYAAAKLHMRQIDTDREMERRAGKKLQQILDEGGPENFRRMEEETLLSVSEDDVIVSTGGSAVYYPAAMSHFKKLGKIIYISVGLPELQRRLGDFSRRGVLLAPGQTIADLYEERVRLYRRYADITLFCNGQNFPRYQWQLIRTICHLTGRQMPQRRKKPTIN